MTTDMNDWGPPFANVPNIARYFPAACVEEARARIHYCLQHDLGPSFLVGPPGTGKSLLLEVLAREFASHFRVVSLSSTRLCTRRAFLQWFLNELGLPYQAYAEGELRLSLHNYLTSEELCGAGVILLIDESHLLPVRILEELRFLLNLSSQGRSRVRLVMAGAPTLEDVFARPELESFSQRLNARCYLTSWGRDDVHRYVEAQLAANGDHRHVSFSTDALDAIYQATDGVPRLINQLCRHALSTSSGEQIEIDDRAIQAAWADLQQLPSPWPVPAAQPSEESSVVEFGSLDDESVDDETLLEDAIDEGEGTRGSSMPASGEKELCGQNSVEDPEPAAVLPFETLTADDSLVDHQSGGETPGAPPFIETFNCDAIAGPLGAFSESTLDCQIPAELSAAADTEAAEPEGGQASTRHEAVRVDPFDEHYAEEELVIDEFVHLEDSLASQSPRVTNQLDATLVAEIEASLPARTPATPQRPSATAEGSEPEIYAIPYICQPDGNPAASGDPVLPENQAEPAPPESETRRDDSDSAEVRPLHRRYRTLFAELRRG